MDKLLEFPLWVKQVIYLKLYQNLSLSLSEDFITTNTEEVFHLYVPPLTFAGKTEMVERKGGYDANFYNFLTSVAEGLNMLEVSMNNFWTMEEVAKYYILCLEQDFVKTPEVVQIQAMAGFMSGKYRTGEYFKRINKIDVDQLEHVIVKQKEYADAGTKKMMGEIMIEMGLVTEKDTTSLLKIKEESKKRFILDATIIPKDYSASHAAGQIPQQPTSTKPSNSDELLKLKEENAKLKDQLRKILVFVKKNG